MLDLSHVQPAARSIVAAATGVYGRHAAPWLVGLTLHDSALKGGYIPGCSDVDIQLHPNPAAFMGGSAPAFPLCTAIQRDLAAIDLALFSYIQCYALPCRLPASHSGPIPGAYIVLAGRLGVPEASARQAWAERLE